MKALWTVLAVLLVLAALCLSSALFTVDETEQAVITRFGRDRVVLVEPGIHMKAPFADRARMLDKGTLRWDSGPLDISTRDGIPLRVEATARWRIQDPLKFVRSLDTMDRAYARMDDTVNPLLKSHVAACCVRDVVSSGGKDASQALDRGPAPVPGVDGCGRAFSGRDRLEASILGDASRALSMCGIGLLDVSLRRFDYSSGVRDQVYGRMIAERKAAAMRLLSEGEGQGSEISGRMEKELKEIMSASVRRAEEIKGKADAEAAAIYAAAYRQDPEFYSFFKTLETYRQTSFENTELILGTDTDFYRYLKGSSK